MIFNPYLYTPPTNKNYYFIGAISEDITIRDSSKTIIDTVTTDATGITTRPLIALPGIYFVTGSVSQYTRMVILEEAGNYKACPDGALYWYGNILQGSSWTSAAIKSTVNTYSSNVGAPTITTNTNDIYLTSKATSTAAGTVYLQKISLKSGKIKMNYAYTYRSTNGYLKVFNSTANNHSVVSSVSLSEDSNYATLELNVDSESYVGVEISSNASPTTTRITIYSIVSEPEEKPGINIYGAANETITYTGASSGSITLDQNGAAKINLLPAGNYVFTGSISNYSTSTIAVNSDTKEIKVYPPKALYWYGNEVVPWTLIKAYSTYDSGSVSEVTDTNPNYMQGTIYKLTNGSNSRANACYYITTAEQIDTSGYTKINFDYSRDNFATIQDAIAYLRIGYADTQTWDLIGNSYTSMAARATYSITSPGTSVYIGTSGRCDLRGYMSTGTFKSSLYAVWLE